MWGSHHREMVSQGRRGDGGFETAAGCRLVVARRHEQG